jgi:hypothetical protein
MNMQSKNEILVLVTDDNFVEENYLESNPDIASAVYQGVIKSGKLHFELYGRNEGRKMRKPSMYSVVMAKIVPQFLRNKSRQQITKNLQLQTQIRDLQAKLNDFEIMSSQLQSILLLEHDIPPAPPKTASNKSSW